MSEPTPLTADELALVRGRAEPGSRWAVTNQVVRRLLATVDDERAEKTRLRAMYEQAERDGTAERARADQAETALALADRALRDQPMQAFRTRAAQMRRAHAIDAVRRALDASPTEGNPDDE